MSQWLNELPTINKDLLLAVSLLFQPVTTGASSHGLSPTQTQFRPLGVTESAAASFQLCSGCGLASTGFAQKPLSCSVGATLSSSD